jgi:hypothetical protein
MGIGWALALAFWTVIIPTALAWLEDLKKKKAYEQDPNLEVGYIDEARASTAYSDDEIMPFDGNHRSSSLGRHLRLATEIGEFGRWTC